MLHSKISAGASSSTFKCKQEQILPQHHGQPLNVPFSTPIHFTSTFFGHFSASVCLYLFACMSLNNVVTMYRNRPVSFKNIIQLFSLHPQCASSPLLTLLTSLYWVLCWSHFFTFCYIFIRHRTYHLFSPYLPYHDPLSLIIRRLYQTASFISLIPYHPNRRSPLVLSSGWFLIPLSETGLLSCTIHQPTKQCYYSPWIMSPWLSSLPTRRPSAVYKVY